MKLAAGLALLLELDVTLGLELLLAWSLGTLGSALALGVLLALVLELELSLVLAPWCSSAMAVFQGQ